MSPGRKLGGAFQLLHLDVFPCKFPTLTSMRFPLFRKPEPDPAWYANAPREGVERKERSESQLKLRGVPINRHLPIVETESQASFRPKEEIVMRIVALTLVAVKGEGALTEPQLKMLVNRFNAADCFSPVERAFIENLDPSTQERVQFSWRYECLWVMLWALSFVPELPYPENLCDVPHAVGFLRELGRDGLQEKAVLRQNAEVLDHTDFTFRCHWAVRDAQLAGVDVPGNLNAGVVQERHYALNWIVQRVAWDDVDTST